MLTVPDRPKNFLFLILWTRRRPCCQALVSAQDNLLGFMRCPSSLRLRIKIEGVAVILLVLGLDDVPGRGIKGLELQQ